MKDVEMAAVEARLLAQAVRQTEMAARLDGMKVRLQDHSELLRQLESREASRSAAPVPAAGPVYIGNNRVLLQTLRGLRLICDSRDLQVSSTLIVDRVWEPAMTEAFERIIKPGARVLDIGAHIGYFTTLACALAGEPGRVDAYEPHPGSYEILRANIRLNRMAHRVCVHRQAVAAAAGVVTLFAFQSNIASSTLSALPERLLEEFGEHPYTTETMAVTLDEQYRGVRERFDFVKIDAEGAEALILRGGQEFLHLAIKPDCVFAIEYNPPASQGLGLKPFAAMQQLSAMGFSLAALENDGSLVPIEREHLDTALDPWCNAAILARRRAWPDSIRQVD